MATSHAHAAALIFLDQLVSDAARLELSDVEAKACHEAVMQAGINVIPLLTSGRSLIGKVTTESRCSDPTCKDCLQLRGLVFKEEAETVTTRHV